MKDGWWQWWAKMSVTLRWGMWVIEVSPGWSGCGCEWVKSSEDFIPNLSESRISNRSMHISTSEWAFVPLADNHSKPASRCFLLTLVLFFLFTPQLLIGRLNLLSVLSTYWPLLIIDEVFHVLHSVWYAQCLKFAVKLIIQQGHPKILTVWPTEQVLLNTGLMRPQSYSCDRQLTKWKHFMLYRWNLQYG